MISLILSVHDITILILLIEKSEEGKQLSQVTHVERENAGNHTQVCLKLELMKMAHGFSLNYYLQC